MVKAKLFILEMEIELLWTDMEYYREVRVNGKANSEVLGGLITVGFSSTSYTDRVLDWMTKESHDKTGKELDKMEKGKVCFYADGFDYPPTRAYEFNDAFLTFFSEEFNAENAEPMTTVITISPAIQNYGVELIKRWNISWVAPNEEEPYQASSESSGEEEKKITDFYITDTSGNKTTTYRVGDTIILNIKSLKKVGVAVDINLKNKTKDFEYNGVVLPNDTLTGYIIKSDSDTISLKVVRPKGK